MEADARTVAECRTSTGRDLRVSFSLAAPPASSYLLYHCEGTEPDDIHVVASHGDSILLIMKRRPRDSFLYKFDHFVYRAGTTDQPPSLSLLAARDIPKQREHDSASLDPGCRVLQDYDTCLMRRGDDELLVAQLEVGSEIHGRPGMADLCLLRLGKSRWELRESVPIVHDDGDKRSEPLYWPGGNKAIAVGDRFMCFLDYHRGFLLCDMAGEKTSKLRHMPMPVSPLDVDRSLYNEDMLPLYSSENIGAAGDDALRFVRIDTRCCCGGPGRSSCLRSRYAYTVTTWTLTLRMDGPMSWVKDGVLDCEELWALPGYENLPRKHLKWPVVSADNPDVVCFTVPDYAKREDQKDWMIQVDTRRKVLLSAVQCTINPGKECFRLPAKLIMC